LSRAAALLQHVAAGILQRRQRCGDLRQIPLAIGGQPHRPRAAHEQFCAELLLQSALKHSI
jgi:hypothetical protein